MIIYSAQRNNDKQERLAKALSFKPVEEFSTNFSAMYHGLDRKKSRNVEDGRRISKELNLFG